MANDTRLVKRYAGTRMYDPAALAYVSIAQLRQWHATKAVIVQDAATGDDVTASVLGTKPDEH